MIKPKFSAIKLSTFFRLAALAALVAWAVWTYSVAMASVKVEDKTPTNRVMVSVDQNAYKSTEKYLEQIRVFEMPDFVSLYSNPEPFREYR